jgi:hypothetical protein
MLEIFAACEFAAVPVPFRHYLSRPGARVIYYFIGRVGREQVMEFGARQVR